MTVVKSELIRNILQLPFILSMECSLGHTCQKSDSFQTFYIILKKLQENIFDLFSEGTSDFSFGTKNICHIKRNQQSKTKNQPKPKPSNLYFQKKNWLEELSCQCWAQWYRKSMNLNLLLSEQMLFTLQKDLFQSLSFRLLGSSIKAHLFRNHSSYTSVYPTLKPSNSTVIWPKCMISNPFSPSCNEVIKERMAAVPELLILPLNVCLSGVHPATDPFQANRH